jgi:hypothetical protein
MACFDGDGYFPQAKIFHLKGLGVKILKRKELLAE